MEIQILRAYTLLLQCGPRHYTLYNTHVFAVYAVLATH